MSLALPERSECLYTSCYCEENVYQLLAGMDPVLAARTNAVFISNAGRTVPIWQQRAGRSEDGLVVWDYHVILLLSPLPATQQPTLVYDLDTRLPFPCPAHQYCSQALGSDREMEEKFHRLLRLIPGPEFLTSLSSDRRHMRIGDEWSAPPPPWPCIQGDSTQAHTLDTHITMPDNSHNLGTVLDLETFTNKFS